MRFVFKRIIMKRFGINLPMIFNVLGVILLLEAFFMSMALFVSIEYSEQYEFKILLSVLITFVSGLVLYFATRKSKDKSFSRKESFLLVFIAWLVISLFGTLPYLLTGAIPHFVDAFFESVSGFTTTGSSILTDIEALPKSVLFWRSMTHWIGGLGIVVLFIALFPSLNIGRIYLFNAEASVVVEEKAFPKFFDIARNLWIIYLVLTIAEIILLYLGGMDIFDSVCHSFATVATGGFSTKNDSIAGYSPYIQYVIAIFMILSATNFNVYLFAMARKFKPIFRNEEVRAYLGILFSAVIIATLVLFFKTPDGLEKSFRLALFNVSSLMTATGFATADYLQWPALALIMVVLVMFIGASSGSTGGGVKVIRYVIMFKKLKNTFKEMLHPNLITTVRYNGINVAPDTVSRVLVFIILYFVVVIVGMLILIASGVDIITAFGSALTAMGGMGPGLGVTGPAGNFSTIPVVGKYTLIALMIIGRLEIFGVLIIFTREFWKA